MTCFAPMDRTISTFLVLHTPVTSAPNDLAICTANMPTPPDAHAYSVLDSYIYGFALEQASLPFQTAEEAVEVANSIRRQFPIDAYPTSWSWLSSTSCSPATT